MSTRRGNYPKQVISAVPDPSRRNGGPGGPPGADLRLGDMSAAARIVQRLPNSTPASVDAKRWLVADLCRLVGAQLNGTPPPKPAPAPATFPCGRRLSPRLRQTLEHLLAGDSEKQVAAKLRISPHTLHGYVKALYHGFDLSSRGELLSRVLRANGGGGRSPENAS